MNSTQLPTPATYSDPTQLPALLELLEGNQRAVYNDGKGFATIGIGFNLSGNPLQMALVLNQMQIGGVNVFASAAARNGMTAAQVVDAFEAVVANNPLQKYASKESAPIPTALITSLNNLLAVLFGLPNGDSLPLGTVSFDFFPKTTSRAVLLQLLTGTPAIHGAGYDYPFTGYGVDGPTGQTYAWLTGHGVTATSNIPPANTGQWEALVSLFFNQRPDRPLLGPHLINAINKGDVGQAWYQIRYQSNKDNRVFVETSG